MKFTIEQLKNFASEKQVEAITSINKQEITLRNIKESKLKISDKVSLSLKLIFKFEVNLKIKCNLIYDIAQSVLNIFEDKYPEDKRPRNAIEAMRLYPDNKITREQLAITRRYADDAATYAATYATYAATYATYATYAAATYATYAATYATYAATYATYATYAAATYATYAATYATYATYAAATYAADAAATYATYAATYATYAADAAAERQKQLELIEKYYPDENEEDNNEKKQEDKLLIDDFIKFFKDYSKNKQGEEDVKIEEVFKDFQDFETKKQTKEIFAEKIIKVAKWSELKKSSKYIETHKSRQKLNYSDEGYCLSYPLIHGTNMLKSLDYFKRVISENDFISYERQRFFEITHALLADMMWEYDVYFIDFSS